MRDAEQAAPASVAAAAAIAVAFSAGIVLPERAEPTPAVVDGFSLGLRAVNDTPTAAAMTPTASAYVPRTAACVEIGPSASEPRQVARVGAAGHDFVWTEEPPSDPNPVNRVLNCNYTVDVDPDNGPGGIPTIQAGCQETNP